MSFWKSLWKLILEILKHKPVSTTTTTTLSSDLTTTTTTPQSNPDTTEWTNQKEGYRVRLKHYKNSPGGMHKGRKCSVKIDTRFHTEDGMTGDNTKVFVDDGELKYYGIDAENNKHDLCFADYERFPKEQNKPCYLKISKGGKLHTVIRIPEWAYGTVYVEKKVEMPR